MNQTSFYRGYEIIRSVRHGTFRIFKGENCLQTEWSLAAAQAWIDVRCTAPRASNILNSTKEANMTKEQFNRYVALGYLRAEHAAWFGL